MSNTEPRPLRELRELLAEQDSSADLRRHYLEAARAHTSASTAVLSELANTPLEATPIHRSEVELVIAAPDADWADSVARHLRSALPAGAEVVLLAPGIPLAGAIRPLGFTVRCEIRLPGLKAAQAREPVRAALARLPDAEVDYSQPLDLFVVAPRLPAAGNGTGA